MSEREPTWLLEHRHNVYSQSGEDGVIGKCLELLPTRDHWCVEFGAWDGLHLSNTANLIVNGGYSAVLIEGDATKFEELRQNFAGNTAVTAMNRFVGLQEDDGLDAILKETPIPADFDFLSIDIDGTDYHVWQATTKYRPKLVCIEYNPTIPTDVTFVQERNPNIKHGSSLSALNELAGQKGYELISVLPTNAIFVGKEYFPLFGITDNRPHSLRIDSTLVTHFFSGYDGTIFLSGNRILPWHGVALDEKEFQVLPRWLRRYRRDFSRPQLWLFNFMYRKFRLVGRLGRLFI